MLQVVCPKCGKPVSLNQRCGSCGAETWMPPKSKEPMKKAAKQHARSIMILAQAIQEFTGTTGAQAEDAARAAIARLFRNEPPILLAYEDELKDE